MMIIAIFVLIIFNYIYMCVCLLQVFPFFRNDSWMWHMLNINGKNTDHSQPQPHEDRMETNHQMDHPFSVAI
jgi:hypothetical protein